MRSVRNLTILGSTGSIGENTLDVVARHPDRFRVVALTANKGAAKMLEQCLRFQPRYAVLLDEPSAEWLRDRNSGSGCRDRGFVWSRVFGKSRSLAGRRRGDGGNCRSCRHPPHFCRGPEWQAGPACKQGNDGNGRAHLHGCRQRKQCDLAADRQ